MRCAVKEEQLARDQWDRLIGIAKAAVLMRGRSGPPNVVTVRLWATRGCRPAGS